MVEYKIVKYCRLCRKRMVVPKGEARKNYCDACIKRMNSQNHKTEE